MSVITQNILGMTHLCISQENNICELHRVVQARFYVLFSLFIKVNCRVDWIQSLKPYRWGDMNEYVVSLYVHNDGKVK